MKTTHKHILTAEELIAFNSLGWTLEGYDLDNVWKHWPFITRGSTTAHWKLWLRWFHRHPIRTVSEFPPHKKGKHMQKKEDKIAPQMSAAHQVLTTPEILDKPVFEQTSEDVGDETTPIVI